MRMQGSLLLPLKHLHLLYVFIQLELPHFYPRLNEQISMNKCHTKHKSKVKAKYEEITSIKAIIKYGQSIYPTPIAYI